MIKTLALLLLLALAPGCGFHPLGTKEDHVRRGLRFAKQTKYDDAELQYRKAIQMDARYGEAYLRYGQLLILRDKTAEAYQILSRAVELMPDSDEAKVALGRMALTAFHRDPSRPQNLYQTAERVATDLLANSPASFEGLRLRGYLAMIDGRTKEAIGHFKTALQANLNEPEISTVLVQNLLIDGRGEEAASTARSALNSVKTYGPLYDALYSCYLSSHRIAEAEEVLKSKIANNPKQAFFVVQLAEHYWRQGNTQQSERLLDTFVGNASNYPTAILEAGDFYRRMGKPDTAMALYQKGLSSPQKQRKEYLERIAGVFLDQGRHQEALSAIETILREYPADIEALSSRASLRMAGNRPEEMRKAIEDLSALLLKAPNQIGVRLNLALAYRQLGQTAEARTQFLELLRRDPAHRIALREMADLAIRSRQPDEALQYAERLLAIDPKNLGIRLVRTSAWALRGRRTEVRAELRRLTSENPEVPEPWLQTATLNLDEENYAEAERILKRLHQPGKNDIRPLKALVAVYLAQNKPRLALELVRQEAQHSQDAAVRSLLAHTARESGDLDLALETAEKLVSAYPENPEYLGLAGELRLQKGQLDLAVVKFQEAHRLAPESALYCAYLGNALGRAERYPEAVLAYRQAVKLRPEEPLWMNNLSWHLAWSETNLDEAAGLVRRALQMSPDNSEFTDTLGIVYLKSRQTETARQIFQTLVRKMPSRPTYRLHLAMALAQLRRSPEARGELEIALKNQPPPEEAAAIRKLFAEL